MENLAGYSLEANIGGVSMLRGEDGKSAYAYAVEGGYTGTEEEFAEKLAAEIPTVDSTLTKSGQAADAAAVGDRLSALSEENVKSAELDEDNMVSFKNADGVVLFTLDLSELGTPASYGNLVLSAESLTIEEGGTGAFTVALDSAPSANQIVYLAVSDNTRLTVSPVTLTFTPANYAEPQTVTVTALQDEDEYDDTITVTLTSKKVDGKQLVVTVSDIDKVPQLVTDGLVFNLELRGRTNENNAETPPEIKDSINNYVCTPYNIDWDGENSGFVENGLLLKSYDLLESPNAYNEKTQSVLGVPPLPDVNFENGLTLEICMDTSASTTLCRFANGKSNNTSALYLALSPKSYGVYAQRFVDTSGVMDTGAYDSYGFINVDQDKVVGEHLYSFIYSPDGLFTMYIDGVLAGSVDYNSKGTFEHFCLFDVVKSMESNYAGSLNGSTSSIKKIICEYRMYNRVLSADEIAENYKVTAYRQTVTNF